MATLQELTERLRLRVGEVDPPDGRGTWDDEVEMKLALNVSQVELAKLLHGRGESWSEKIGTQIPVQDSIEYYVLPDNFMVEESVAHYQPQFGYQKMAKGSVQDIRLSVFNNLNYSGTYAAYEVRGRTEVYVATGTAKSGSNASTLLDHEADFSNVRIGDVAHNLTDDSQATVVDFTGGQIRVDDWKGGYSQRFYAGEGYRIAQRERTAYQLWCYPPIKISGSVVSLNNFQLRNFPTTIDTSPVPVLDNQNGASFTLDQDVVVTGVQFQVSALPEDWQEDSVLAFYFSAEDGVVKGSSFGLEKVRLGYNTVPKFVPFRLRQGVQYDFVTFGGATISNLKLSRQTNNFVELNYTPLPKPMLYFNSICEYPDQYLEPLLDYAKILLYDKIYPNGEMFAALQQRFNLSKDQAREYNQIAEAATMDTVMGVGSSAYQLFDRQPGYTLNHGIVAL